MTLYLAKAALLPDGWAEDALITVDDHGWITDVQAGQAHSDAVALDGFVLPGMPNLHSHAFQRAMAGLTERATGEKDSFWTWRETMYDFLGKITPDDQEAIAAQLYVEMLKSGYTGVAEFHYLHHGPDGTPYDDRAETSHRIIRAAKSAGIAITHMPVLYAYGGFGGQEAGEGQRRFLNSEEGILDILASLQREYEGDPQCRIGFALHSLRAVSPEMLTRAVDGVRALDPAMPVHIHIAEQVKEVEDCLAWSGQRPVEWLFDHADVDRHWCLVHATHMTEQETAMLAQSGAVAGICPTTEANLGDGLFNLPDYIGHGGALGIGSDSHTSVNMIEELRLMEYGQRLLRRERAVTKLEGNPSVGSALYRMALSGGAQALGHETGALETGKRADFIVLDKDDPALLHKNGDTVLDSLIFAANANPVTDVFCGGQHVVKNRKHINEDKILNAYEKVLAKLLEP